VNLSILDTYEADLLNETPPRREGVSEIQDREDGRLICYASPKEAPLVLAAVQTHEAFINAAQRVQEHALQKSEQSVVISTHAFRQLCDTLKTALELRKSAGG